MAFGMVESEFRLGPLDLEASIGFLDHGLELEHRRRVAEALGGHPSALLMHDPTHEIPEASDGIQSFVSDVILAGLEPVHVLSTVDELCLEPLPVPADEARDRDAPWPGRSCDGTVVLQGAWACGTATVDSERSS